MISYTEGNLLTAPAEALVNTVNEVGVMGRGIALMFREAFPLNAIAYEAACKKGRVRVGHMFVTKNDALIGPHWIINFPTKKHWRSRSELVWVKEGLSDLVRVIDELGIKSIAVPPLGCGNGGLKWDDVRLEIESALGSLSDVDVFVYGPSDHYQNAPKTVGAEKLTPARALIAELVRRYSVLGLECTNLEVQKLAWFLHRTIRRLWLRDPLSLKFSANKYGPYADRLRHLLNGLDGSYLHCAKRLSDAGPFDPIWFEDSRRAALEGYLNGAEAVEYAPALELTSATIDGFESPLGMELLATVDWLISEASINPDVGAIRDGLGQWPGGIAAGRRKRAIFDDRMIELSLNRLAAMNDRFAHLDAK